MTQRHTYNYFKEKLGSNRGIEEVMAEIIKKYGENDKIRLNCKFNWNHSIEGFGICQYGKNKGKIYVDIYWQGDSTDGNDDAWLNDILYSYGDYIIPAEVYGGYERHGKLRIDKEEFSNAINTLIDFINPKEVKKRKEEKKIYNVLYSIIDEKRLGYKNKGMSWYNSEKHCNGEDAMRAFVKKHIEKLYKKSEEEIKEQLELIYSNNFKDNRLMKKTYYGEKIFDFGEFNVA